MSRKSKYEQGFTLIEMLICLSILFSLIAAAPRIYPLILSPSTTAFNDFEWILFLEQVQIEFREANYASSYDKKLILQNQQGAVITHSQSGNRLIRRVNGAGHEILLQNIKAASFEVFSSKVLIHIEDVYNEKHTGCITRFHPVEVSA